MIVQLSDLPAPPGGTHGFPWTEASPPLPAMRPDGQAWQRISIVTPAYQHGQFIEKTIRSVLLQGYSNLDYIVMDGGSTDETVGILEKYAPWFTYWESQRDNGQSHAINKGFARAEGTLINWLNSDDYLMPGALQRVAEAFAAAPPQVAAIAGVGQKVTVEGRVILTPRMHEITTESILNWLSGTYFNQPACFFTRAAFEACGPLDESLHYCMDVDLWLSISKSYQFQRLDVVLAQALHLPDAKTVAHRSRATVEHALVCRKHGYDELGYQTLMQLADELTKARKTIRRVTHNPVYRALKPLLRRLPK